MSQYPTQPGQPHIPTYQPPQTNGLGIAGFVVSLSGMVVCFGLICPIGLILSLVALGKEPRGFAIAGSIMGALGTLLAGFGILVVTGAIGSGLWFSSMFVGISQTYSTMSNAEYDIDNYFTNNNSTLPDDVTGNNLIAHYADEWGQPLKYEATPGSTTDYTLSSAGPDGVFGSGDDIVQYLTGYNYNTPGGYNATTEVVEEVDGTQVNNAFDLAAAQLGRAFPAGRTALPTEAEIHEQAGNLVDPWLTPLRYRPTDNPPWYHLQSAGPDKTWGTGDDITRSFYFAPEGPVERPQ